MAKKQTSQAGRALAHCRWGKKKAKAAPKKKTAVPVRRSRRQAGMAAETVRQPEPKKKPKKPRAKRKPPNRKASGKKIEEILVPGVNPKKNDMKNFLEEQRRIWS